MNDYTVTDFAAHIQGNIGVDNTIISQSNLLIDDNIREYLTAIANNDVIANIGKWAYIDLLADFCRWRNECKTVYAGLLLTHGSVIHL